VLPILLERKRIPQFKMDSDGIVPDVIDVLPTDIMEVKYGDLQVNNGNELTPSQVKEAPTSISWPTEDGSLYTLLMTDPDAPSREKPKFREWHHWLVVNIPGCVVNKGEVQLKYVGSGPPKGTKLHRYVFLAYKQPSRISYSDTVVCTKPGLERASRKARDLAATYNLGKPVAGNYFQAEHEG